MFFSRRNLSLAAGMAAAVALTAGALIASTADTASGPDAGDIAPLFTGLTSTGGQVSLSDFAGKTVVLEWSNDGCPFVRKHYEAPPSNMQTLQAEAAAGDAVWLTLISSAPGKQGYADGARANELTASRDALPTHVILDASGEIGHLYGAKTTPEMFVIGRDGRIAYHGAIDSIASAQVSDIDIATRYVGEALESLASGKPITVTTTKPYRCPVKY